MITYTMLYCKKIYGVSKSKGTPLLTKVACALALLFVFSPFTASAEVVDRIVAIINSNIITLSELNAATTQQLDSSTEQRVDKGNTKELQSRALEDLINQKLIKQASDSAGINVTEREIDSAIDDVMRQNSLSKKDLMLALAKNGMSMREYRDKMRAQLREAKFVDMEFKSKILVLPEEIEDYYRQNIKEFLQPPTFRARIIFLSDTDSSLQSARLKAINEGLKQNEPFEELARQFSDDPTASSGGDLGWLSKGELDPELERAVEELKPGGVSRVIKRPGGIYLLQLKVKRESEPASMAESTLAIQKILFGRRMEKRFSSWLREARKYAHIEKRL